MFTNCYVNVKRCNKEGCWCKPDNYCGAITSDVILIKDFRKGTMTLASGPR